MDDSRGGHKQVFLGNVETSVITRLNNVFLKSVHIYLLAFSESKTLQQKNEFNINHGRIKNRRNKST